MNLLTKMNATVYRIQYLLEYFLFTLPIQYKKIFQHKNLKLNIFYITTV